jgi:aryl-alcohol dehydrogenase-like predicted oxidoreductase
MTNTLDLATLPDNDFRKSLPRYQEQNAANNNNLAAGFAEIATAKGCTPAQLAIAWVLSRGEGIIPIPGTKRRKYLLENAGAVDLSLSTADLQQIETLLEKFPDTGDRYNESNARFVDRT